MKIKETQGITLIAVIITIIVLAILAGVAIANIGGSDSIINNAKKAVGLYNSKADEETTQLSELQRQLEEYASGGGSTGGNTGGSSGGNDNTGGTTITYPTKQIATGGSVATSNVTIVPSSDNPNNLQIVIPAGFAPAVLQTGNTQSLPGQDGSVKGIMANEEWKNITADDINKGIVVVDAEWNEFVWIPVLDIDKFKRDSWDGTSSQVTFSNSAYWEETNTNMGNSVSTNKGFYIARYEASKDSTATIAQSKRGQFVWNNVSQTDAITAASKYNTTLNSHLIYGTEWDTVLNWLVGNAYASSPTEGALPTLMKVEYVRSNSANWGNYRNSTGNAVVGSGKLEPTGTSEYWKANNIYDLAGNVWEWTQEKYGTGTTRAYRGGSYDYDGSGYPAARRNGYAESYARGYIGFRVSFYL